MNAPRASAGQLLFLEGLATIAGGQTVLLDLAAGLQARYGLWALLPADGPLAQRLTALGVRCRMAPMGSYSLVGKTARDAASYALRLPWLVVATWRLIRQARIGLVYANSSRTFVWGTLAAALAGRPIMWHQHNVLADRKSIGLLNLVGRLAAVRRIICASAEAGQALAPLARKLVVIPNGIDTAHFCPDPAAGAAVRQAWGVPRQAPLVGLVGDLIPLKGQHTFLEAARELAARRPEARFCLVGAPRPDGESQRYAAELRAQAAGTGLAERVIFAGQRNDMPAVLNAVDVLVVASTTETVPLVLLEALACGVPVVSTPVGRAPELLADGAAGRLFPIGQASALAAALFELLQSPVTLARLGRQARALAEARFPLARLLEQIDALIAAELRPAAHDLR